VSRPCRRGSRFDAALEKHLAFARKSAAREYTQSIGGAILVATTASRLRVRAVPHSFGLDDPTLLVGDFIFVNKMAYGLRIPFHRPAKVHKLWSARRVVETWCLHSTRSTPTSIT